MEENKKKLDANYFNELYSKNPDPWNFEQSEYEKMKYANTMLIIPNGIYENGFEIGCSNGVLTMMLCQRCQKLLAVDSSGIAVANASKRLADNRNVTVREMEIPNNFPGSKFDLILFSEVGYFLTKEDLLLSRDKMVDALLPGGHMVLVHWTPQVEEFPLTGDQVHDLFKMLATDEPDAPLIHLKNRTEPEYRMDLFEKK